jgi:hypothetical protein
VVVPIPIGPADILLTIRAKEDAARALKRVENHLDHLARSAAVASVALKAVGTEGVAGLNREIDRHGPGMQKSLAKWLLTPNRSLFQTLARPFASAFSVPVVAAIGAAVAVSLAGPISAALVAGITGGLGLGALALAGFALRESNRLKRTFSEAGVSISRSLKNAAAPLVPVFDTAVRQVAGIIGSLAPQFRALFMAAAPIVPILVRGFGEFANGIMPAIIRSMPTAVRMIELIAAHAPKLATAFGDFLDILIRNEPLFRRTLDMTLGFAERALPALGMAMVVASGYFIAFWATVKAVTLAIARAGDVFETFSKGLLQLGTGDVKGAISNFASLKGKTLDIGEAFTTAEREMRTAWTGATQVHGKGTASMLADYRSIGSAVGTASDKTAIALLHMNEKVTQTQATLDKLKESVKTNAAAMHDALLTTIPAFEGVQRHSRQTASGLNKNLRDQIAEARRWSTNMQTLLKRGADPKFVQALAIKGPEYVAAYVRGGTSKLREGERLWQILERAKSKATKTESAIALAAVRGMVNKMNLQLANLKAQVVALQGNFGWQGLKVFSFKGGAKALAKGGPITEGTGPTADDVVARLSRGEFVVNAKSASQHRDLLESINKSGLPGYARGGAVLPKWQYSQREMNRWWAQGTNNIIANLKAGQKAYMTNFMAGLGDIGPGGGSASLYRMVGAARSAMSFFSRMFPAMTIGGWRATGSVPGSDHPKGKALDLMTSSRALHRLIISIFEKMPGAKYWISYREIGHARDGFKPRYYGGPSPHTDHPHLSFYDKGGKLRPGWTMAWNGTGRDETVTPASGSSGTTINVTITGPVYGADSRALAKKIQMELLKIKRENGGVKLGLT